MMPKDEDVVPFNPEKNGEDVKPLIKVDGTFAERLNHSKIINYTIVGLGMLWIILYFINNGFNLELNILNFMFIVLGLALHGSPEGYLNAIISGMSAAGGILIQFPFYAGIMGMMAGSGLITIISESIVSFSTDFTFPILTYISGAIVNMFVPSAGGQWQIQGPIMLEALKSFNLPPSVVVNAVSVGDMTTNLLQPFFVLPALGLSKLGLKDIWGYCFVAFMLLFIVSIIVFLLTPLFL